MKNYGLIIPTIQPEQDYVLGGFNSIGGEVLQPDGQWLDWLPLVESQTKNGFDAIACASFGSLNGLEMLARRIYGQERNWSDRFLAKASNTTPQGNDPHKVAETLRDKGVPNEIDYPFSNELLTWAQFYSDIPSAISSLALAFKAEFNFLHEYVITKPEYLMQALKYSPVPISVTAWFKGADGLYYFPEGINNNHWCVLVGYVENKHWIIYDSYENDGDYLKEVKWDSKFAIAKRFSLNRQVVSEKGWIQFLIDLVLAAFGLPNPTQAPVDVVKPNPAPDTVPAPESPIERLAEEAKAWLGMDASPQNKAPQELSCAEGVVNIVNACWPNTLSESVVGTDALFTALKKSPKFKSSLDPVAGCIIVSPRTATVNGHTGIYTEADKIASNDSRDGKWRENYTRASWRQYFIVKKKLKGYFFVPK